MKKLCLSTIWKSSRNAATCRAVRHRQCGRDACQRSSNEIMMRNCYMQQGSSWDVQEHFVLWIFWNSGASLEHVTCWNSMWDRKILEDSNLNSQPGAEQLHASSWRPAASSTTHAAETKAAKIYCRMLQIYHIMYYNCYIIWFFSWFPSYCFFALAVRWSSRPQHRYTHAKWPNRANHHWVLRMISVRKAKEEEELRVLEEKDRTMQK